MTASEMSRSSGRVTTDKIGFAHTTPLTDEAVRALTAHQKVQATIGDTWVFPDQAGEPCTCHALRRWWNRAVKAARLPTVDGRSFHSLPRKWASEMKHTPLRDLAHMGGWKNPATLLMVYQQPDLETQVAALAGRKQITSVAQG